MSSALLDMLRLLYRAALEQRMSVKEGRIDDSLKILSERQRITDELQRMLGSIEAGNKFPVAEKYSSEAKEIINSIISIDSELRTILETDKQNISSKLQSIQQIKQLVVAKHAYHDTSSTINVNI